MRNHRVPLLGDGWRLSTRRTPDPETSRDPQTQLIMAGLAQLAGSAATPRAEFRSELRAQLVAIAPRVVAEGDPATVAAPERARVAAKVAAPRAVTAGGGSSRAAGSGRSTGARVDGGGALALPIGRIFAVAAAMVVAMLVLAGGAVYFSSDALPGDSLYGVKLAAERAELATDSDADRPGDLLRFASTRVDEAQQLVASRATAAGTGPIAGGVSPQTQALIGTALSSFDSDVQQASRLLGSQAVAAASRTTLATLTTWVPGQVDKLRALSSTLSGTTVSSKVDDSLSVVTAAGKRARALAATVDCHCLTGTPSDSFGPLPTVPAPARTSTGTAAPTTGSPSTSTAPSSRTSPTRGQGGLHLPGLQSPTGAVTIPPLRGVTPSVPSVPTGSAHPPLTANTCGLQVDLPIAKVSLGKSAGSCKTS